MVAGGIVQELPCRDSSLRTRACIEQERTVYALDGSLFAQRALASGARFVVA